MVRSDTFTWTAARQDFPNGTENGQYLDGNIARILVYDTTGLSQSQITSLNNSVSTYLQETYYLDTKYNLTSSVTGATSLITGGSTSVNTTITNVGTGTAGT